MGFLQLKVRYKYLKNKALTKSLQFLQFFSYFLENFRIKVSETKKSRAFIIWWKNHILAEKIRMLVSIFCQWVSRSSSFWLRNLVRNISPSRDNWFGILISSLWARKIRTGMIVGKTKSSRRNIKFPSNCLIPIKHGICILPTHEQLLRRAVESLFREHL